MNSSASRDERRVVVVGSLNMDLVMRVPRIPVAGETLAGHGFEVLPGGKGANQAVACARMGVPVAMVGLLGNDAHGDALRAALDADAIDRTAVGSIASAHTGIAMIWVEDSGENRIVLAPGANASLDVAAVERAGQVIDAARMLVLQFEVPIATVEAAVARANAAGVPVLLNPAPAAGVPDGMWAGIDTLVVNGGEAGALAGFAVTGVSSAVAAAERLRGRGASRVLVTLGARGVVVLDQDGPRHRRAQPVQAIDTTAAGDTFIGGLVAGLTEGMTLDAAVALGQSASAVCVTRRGAQASIPCRRDLTGQSGAAVCP